MLRHPACRTLLAAALAVAAAATLRLTATTPASAADASLPPLDVQLVDRVDNTVTLAWSAVPTDQLGQTPTYQVFDGSTLWATRFGGDNPKVTISRLQAGRTHRLTVRYYFVTYDGSGRAVSPSSDPIDVAVAATGDTTAPTAPTDVRAQFDETTYFERLTWTASTDDTTAQSEIFYELLDTQSGDAGELVIDNNAVQPYQLAQGTAVRAVDASGNRSDAVPISRTS
jgi:hypothetical protein